MRRRVCIPNSEAGAKRYKKKSPGLVDAALRTWRLVDAALRTWQWGELALSCYYSIGVHPYEFVKYWGKP